MIQLNFLFIKSTGNETDVSMNENGMSNNINRIENRRSIIRICPSGWHRFKFKCYHFNRVPATFHDTIKYCNTFPYNSKMAILHTKEEEEFLSRLIFIKFKDSSPWLGGTQVAPGSPDYKWIDGSPFDYHNWQEPDEPDCGSSCCGIQLDYFEVDNTITTNEKRPHLVLFNKTIRTFWRDVNCNKELKRVCQIELSPKDHDSDPEHYDQNSKDENIFTENEIGEDSLRFQEIATYDLITLINMTKVLDKKISLLLQMDEPLISSIENTQRTILDSEINSSKNFYAIRAAHEEFKQLLTIFTRDDYYFRINWTTELKKQGIDLRNLVDKSQMISCRKIFDPSKVGQTVETSSFSGDSSPLSDSNFPLESLLVLNLSSTQHEAGQGEEGDNIITLKGLKLYLDHVSKVIINETKRLDEKIDYLSHGQSNISSKLLELESIQSYCSLPAIMLAITLIMTCASLSLILSIYLNMSTFTKSIQKCSCFNKKNRGQDFEMVVHRIDTNSNYNKEN